MAYALSARQSSIRRLKKHIIHYQNVYIPGKFLKFLDSLHSLAVLTSCSAGKRLYSLQKTTMC